MGIKSHLDGADVLPAIERELDDRDRIVLTRDIFNFGKKVIISPNTFSAIMYPKGTSLEHVIKSTKILLEDLEHQLEAEREKKK